MFGRLQRFFGPPRGGNDAITVRARLLGRVLNVHVVVALSLAVFYPAETEAGRAVRATALATVPLALLMRGVMNRGLARTASWIFLVFLSVLVPGLSIYLTGSVALVSVSVFQMMLIVMAGLLLGGREAIVFAVLIVGGNGLLLRMEALRLPERAEGLYAAWILQLVCYIATAALLARAIALTEELFTLATREAVDRRSAEAALRESMERYRLITAVSSDYTFSTDFVEPHGLRLNWVAGAFETITGFSFDEYVARGGWRAALHPEDADRDARDLEQLRQNRPVASELRTVCKDGRVRWVRIYALPVWDEAKQRLAGIYGAVQDISARKAAEAEREALIRELEARNAELERFTYTVSHDLKSPLITIRGFLGHIEQAAIEGKVDAVRADMDRVYKSTARMHQLLDDLLELSRIGRLAKPPEEIPFEAIVRDALDRTHGRLSSNKVTVTVAENLPTVCVDRDRLVEVMQNLIDNAAKFKGDRADPAIWIGTRRVGDDLAFYVRDNGIGIEARYRDRVFNLFDKLDPKSAGTGVGLALVKRIVEVHGGRIWVESEGPGTGATFLFTLGEAAREPRPSSLPGGSS
ncbi:MAG: PAS domain S-box protein [Vicinamibacteria bacterium]|nr:PAS domain S-box protein [Vicinamibacteria bacterium]